MSVAAFLRRIVEGLERNGIAYMVAGSMASTHHGRPRTTHDVDIVIAPTVATILEFVRELPAETIHVSEEAARDAVRRRAMFNVIDLESGWKIDLIVRKDRPFSIIEFQRREPVDLLGIQVFMATAEDTILSKLEWASISASERQLSDVEGVLEVVEDSLDMEYVERWADALGLVDLWRRVRSAAGRD